MREMSDYLQRQQALNCHESFIVQAPAGSGKTELLTQRYLKLLSLAEKAPEEIIAITFTKKAAAEMHSRIVHALNRAQHNTPYDQEPEKTTRQLALAVLKRDEQLEWELMKNPNRLRIQTIDSLCSLIAHQLPILSQFGATANIVEDATEYYTLAAQECMSQLEDSNSGFSNDIAQILQYLDNHYLKCQRLLTEMLKTRDQWLPYLTPFSIQDPSSLKKLFCQSLKNIVTENLEKLRENFSHSYSNRLLPLLQFAQENLQQTEPNHFLAKSVPLTEFPRIELENIEIWKIIGEILFTKDFTWRKSINKNQGFPAKNFVKDKEMECYYAEMKEQMLQLLDELSTDTLLTKTFVEFLQSPPIDYHERQWKTLLALINLLPNLAAQLILIFRDYGVVDFIQVTQAALAALGDNESPSDTALNLDYQIRHILFDEFQDTSLTQFQLLKRLTAGWQPHDGHSLFLVGDPMQSIYRFRQAEVGLFLQVQKYGINDIKLVPLTLTENFRSAETIVAWINNVFGDIFPCQNLTDLGAIHYSPASASKNDMPNSNVQFHPVLTEQTSQSETIVATIQHLLSHEPNQSIAILVRSRSHLIEIITAIQQSKIPYQAVEIERLIHQPLIQDLFALTRALDHLGDRIAWLAMLRAPWCALTLNDLQVISASIETTIWHQVLNYTSLPDLSEDAKQRLHYIMPVLQRALNQRNLYTFSRWVELTWKNLGGHALLEDNNDSDNAKTYFQCLQQVTANEKPFTIENMQDKLSRLYSTKHDSSENPIQIMTIHKAKGLEFDTVIIPHLEKSGRADNNDLLAFDHRLHTNDPYADIILAPIHASSLQKEPIYQYLRRREQQKQYYELQRLLYVAVTRAKQQIHLFADVALDETEQIIKPFNNKSFLNELWPFLDKSIHFEKSTTLQKPRSEAFAYPPLQRCTLKWLGQYHNNQAIQQVTQGHNENIQFLSFEQSTALAIGSVVHRYLQTIAEEGVNQWSPERITQNKNAIKIALKLLNIVPEALDFALNTVIRALVNTLTDPNGLWILSCHLDEHCEFAVQYQTKECCKEFILDRTFIENGNRWILDYKTVDHLEQDLTTFLHEQTLVYKPQLTKYAEAMAAMSKHPIRLGLYFPLQQALHSWDFNEN